MITAADLFCGAGGTSTGLIQACEAADVPVHLTAINHWEVAVSTHTANHPAARHLCASLDSLNPRDLYGEGELDLLWASPECTHHSVARGGRPINDQSRATAWCVVRWAEALRPKIIMIENVPEFQTWGAIDAKGKPMKSKRGATFMAWVAALRSLGYRVEWQILCAADYGDPTTRKRLFVQAVRGNRKIVWPEPSHVDPKQAADFLKTRTPWRGAKEIIDWDLPSTSIYKRQKPLSPKTVARIMAGLHKYGLKPYVVAWDNHGGNGGCHWDSDTPLSTITTKARHGVVEPYLVQVSHGDSGSNRSRSRHTPLPTVTGSNDWALAEPYIIPHRGENGQQQPRSHSIREPLPTVTAGGVGHALVEPFLVSYYGNGEALSLSDPIDTVTTKDRFGLVQPTVTIKGEKYLVDIRFRMLQPHELAAAQGFPTGYKFTGTKTEGVKQIGNAVPVGIARALCTSALQRLMPTRAIA